MNAAGQNVRAGLGPNDLFQQQVTYVRPHQFETPDSYLRRLCEANVIDPTYINGQAQIRRRRTGRATELGHVIAELGGPPIDHFRAEYTRALGDSPLLPGIFGTHRSARVACNHCAAGAEVETFDHRRFMICLKQHRWVGSRQQTQIVDHELLTVERRFRRLAATDLIPPFAHDAVVAALNRHADEPGDQVWRGHRRHDFKPVDRYPALVLILLALAGYLAENWPLGAAIGVWHRRPEQLRLYDYLRPRLSWLGHRSTLWKFTDELVAIALDILASRSSEFSASVDGPSGHPS